MPNQHATDFALATDGYFFSTEPFHQHQYIEAIQLACLLGSNTDQHVEVILEAESLTDKCCYQLALTGELCIQDAQQQPVCLERLQKLPLEELCTAQLIKNGWNLVKQPRFRWLKQQQPFGQAYDSIEACAAAALDNLRHQLHQNRAA